MKTQTLLSHQYSSSHLHPERNHCRSDIGSCQWCSGTSHWSTGCWSSCIHLCLRFRAEINPCESRCCNNTLYAVHCKALPLRKGLPLMKSPLCEKPGPRGQSWANSGVPFSGHSSHSGPQATPTEQQQASTRCLPGMGVPQRSSSWVR